MSGLDLFFSYSQEADTTGKLMEVGLEPEQRLQVARQRAQAICTLVSMGEMARAPELASMCAELAKSDDPRAHELSLTAQCALDFEKQFLFCKHRSLVERMLALAEDPASGEAGKKFANRLREHQTTDWRLTSITIELRELATALPEGNPLTPHLDSLWSKVSEVETMLENETSAPPYQNWVAQAQYLVTQYPDNGSICRGILDRHQRLTDLQFYEEARTGAARQATQGGARRSACGLGDSIGSLGNPSAQ
jgi:hypothetical protein